MRTFNLLVLGAAYGLLPSVRMLLAGHRVTVVCREAEQQAIASTGARIELLRRSGELDRCLSVPAGTGPSSIGTLGLVGAEIDPSAFDLAFLAMGEPQYAAPEITALLKRLGDAGLPVISLMNALPPPFLRRLGTIEVDQMQPAYSSWPAWQSLDPDQITAASPDAQAVRRDPSRPGDLTVTLASNFKVAPFARAADQAMLDALAQSVSAYRPEGKPLPVRLLSHGALHVPLAKWPMLIAGNCRCLTPDGGTMSIAEVVHSDLGASQVLYDWVLDLVRAIGAEDEDLVPFAPYAKAAKALTRPSSFARAIASGAPAVERVDKMVQLAERSLGQTSEALDAMVSAVDALMDRRAG